MLSAYVDSFPSNGGRIRSPAAGSYMEIGTSKVSKVTADANMWISLANLLDKMGIFFKKRWR